MTRWTKLKHCHKSGLLHYDTNKTTWLLEQIHCETECLVGKK